MCGIIGKYTLNPSPEFETRLQAGLKAMQHRGPDDQGLHIEAVEGGSLALGHKRLSIIDLSPGGHQPMHSHDGRFTIVYNGEIYNYKELREELRKLGNTFHTESDTEVLIAAWAQWGKDCLRKLTGMFAFAIFDRYSKTLTLARDAFGIKPLYYWWHPETFSFASEIPALLSLSAERPILNLQRAYDYLAWGSYDDQEATFFKGILHVTPGNWVQISLNQKSRPNPVRWWWPDISERTDLTFNQASEKLREMFLDNVRLHLRSDVSLGAALSGGIDSSAVVCAMRLIEPDMPIHTFTFVARGSAMDEERWADMVNEHVGAIVHKVEITPEEMAADIDDMILAQGEPFGSTSIYAQYRVFKLARENGITVTLEGQGADELLAGYGGYPGSRIQSLLERRKIISLVQFIFGSCRWPGRKKMVLHAVIQKSFPGILNKVFYKKENHSIEQCINFDFLQSKNVNLISIETGITLTDAHGRRVMNELRNSLTTKGLPSLLRHGDRNAMHWTIEGRVPFLTPDLAEFLLSLPEHYLISQSGETKSIFRQAMRGIVPDLILDRRDKIGFATPEQQWLRNIDNKIFKWLEIAKEIPFLNIENLNKEVKASIYQSQYSSWKSWRLINFCRWWNIYYPEV